MITDKMFGGLYLFIIVFAIALTELHVVRRANIALKRSPDLGEATVPVTINGITIPLVVDTGTMRTSVDSEIGKKLGLPNGLQWVTMKIAGSDREFQTQIDVGGLSVSGASNIITPFDIFAAGMTFIISQDKALLVPSDSTEEIPSPKESDIKLQYELESPIGHIPYLNAKINGRQVLARIDTGAQNSIVDLATARRLGLGHRIKYFPTVGKDPNFIYMIGGIDDVTLQIGNSGTIKTKFQVVSNKTFNDPVPIMIGRYEVDALGFTQVYSGTSRDKWKSGRLSL